MPRGLIWFFILVAGALVVASCGDGDEETRAPVPTAAAARPPAAGPTVGVPQLLAATPATTLEPTAAPESTLEPTPQPTGTVAPGEEAPAPTPTHEAMVMEEPAPGATRESVVLVQATPSPATQTTVAVTPTPSATPGAKTELPAVQEFAIIENYTSTRFFPRMIEVVKDVPVKLYLTRLHREHVNQFTISPFLNFTPEIFPGEVGVLEFVPDQLGEFKIRNAGHNFNGTLVVVETIEDVKQRIVDRGVKMLALIYSVEDDRVFPEESLVVTDVPVKVFTISLIEEHRVSISPFYLPEETNVKRREISSFDFTPDATGEFAIEDEIHGLSGTLIVEEKR